MWCLACSLYANERFKQRGGRSLFIQTLSSPPHTPEINSLALTKTDVVLGGFLRPDSERPPALPCVVC